MPSSSSSLDHPPWEDVLLYSISIETRKKFEEAVQTAKTERRKNSSLSDDYIFYSGNKVALPKEEFIHFFRKLLVKGYWILETEKEKANNDSSGTNNNRNTTFSLSGGGKQQRDNDDDDDENDMLTGAGSGGAGGGGGYMVKSSTPKVSILATALQQMNNQAYQAQARQQQQQQASKAYAMINASGTFSSSMMSGASLRGANTNTNTGPSSSLSAKDIYSMDISAIEQDPGMRSILRSIDRFLQMFFVIADAEKGGRLDWDRIVAMVEEVISAGGVRNLAGHRFDAEGNPLIEGKRKSVADAFGADQNQEDMMSQTFAQMSPQEEMTSSAFTDELKAASEHESNIGLACASMRVLRVMRYVGERNKTILPSAAAQLENIKARLKEAEETAALTNRIKDPVLAVTEPYKGAPPTRGDFGGSILGPPPMYNIEAKALRPPICNMNQSRILLDTPYEPSLQVTCAVQPFAASPISRMTYQASTGMFSALCKETNEIRFVGESQAFLQRLSLKEESKIECVALWKTVAASKAMAQGAGSIFEACAYSCFLGMLDGTVHLYSLRDTRIGPGMRNIQLRLETRVPSGYVVCAMHVPHAKPSSVFSGTSTGDLIHWNFDPHIVDDFVGGGSAAGTEVTQAQAAAFRKLMVFRRTIHDGPIVDLSRLGDVGVIDLSQFKHPDDHHSGNSNSSGQQGQNDSNNTNNNNMKSDSSNNNNPSTSSSAGGVGTGSSSSPSSGSSSSSGSDCSIISVGFDGYACVSDVYSASSLRRFKHPAGLLCCTSITNSIFSSAGFVNEPHIWDVRAGSSTKPTMRLYDKRHPHIASVTSLGVMSHLLPRGAASSSSSSSTQDNNTNNQQQSSNSFLSPLISCDSVGRLNVWDLRVGKTLSSFDVHDLLDEATEALPDQKKSRNRSTSAKKKNPTAASAKDELNSLKEHKYSNDSCRATISRRTGRIFVTSESRSAVAEFGSVTPIGQDPRGCFPSEAIIAIQYVPSLRVIVTCHVDVVIVWELSRTYESKHVNRQRRNRDRARERAAQLQRSMKMMKNSLFGGNNGKTNDNSSGDFFMTSTNTNIGNQQQSSSFGDFFDRKDDENVYEEDVEGGGITSSFFGEKTNNNSHHQDNDDDEDQENVEQCPFAVSELHEFLAPDIDAAAAQASREKVFFKDKNSNKPPICHAIRPKERITAFCLHSRGTQYSIGTNQGRIMVCRIIGGEILFQTEKSIHPKPNTEIRWIASASAPNVYSGLSSEDATNRIGGLVSLAPTKKKKAQASFGFDGLDKSESALFTNYHIDGEEEVFLENSVNSASGRTSPNSKNKHQKKAPNAHLQTKSLLQDDSIVSIGSDDSVLCVHTMRQQVVQIYPKGSPLQCRVASHDVLAVMCDENPYFYFCDPLVASTVPALPKPELRHPDVSSPMTALSVAPWLNVAFAGDSCGVLHCYAVKPHILAEAGADAHLYSATFGSGDANCDLSKVNPNAPAICSVQCHHVGAQTMQEFTLVVAGDDVGRIGWWRAMGEIEVVGDKQKEAIHRRRSSLAGGVLLSSSTPLSATSGRRPSSRGGGRVSFVGDDSASLNSKKNNNATLSQFTFGNTNNNTAAPSDTTSTSIRHEDSSEEFTSTQNTTSRTRRLSNTTSSASQSHSAAPKYYVKPSLYWENSCKFHEGRIVGLSIFTKHDTEFSGLAALWIAAAGSDGRVSIVRASTGEFISLLSASPAARLANLTSVGNKAHAVASSQLDQNQQMAQLLGGGASSPLVSASERRNLLNLTGGRFGGGVVDNSDDTGVDVASGKNSNNNKAKRKRIATFSDSTDFHVTKNNAASLRDSLFFTSAVFAESAAKSWMSRSGIGAAGAGASRSTSPGSNTKLAQSQRAILESTTQRRSHDPSKLFEGTKRDFSMKTLFWMRRFMHNCQKAVKARKTREACSLKFQQFTSSSDRRSRASHCSAASIGMNSDDNPFRAFGGGDDDDENNNNNQSASLLVDNPFTSDADFAADAHPDGESETETATASTSATARVNLRGGKITTTATSASSSRGLKPKLGSGLGATFGRRFSAALDALGNSVNDDDYDYDEEEDEILESEEGASTIHHSEDDTSDNDDDMLGNNKEGTQQFSSQGTFPGGVVNAADDDDDDNKSQIANRLFAPSLTRDHSSVSAQSGAGGLGRSNRHRQVSFRNSASSPDNNTSTVAPSLDSTANSSSSTTKPTTTKTRLRRKTSAMSEDSSLSASTTGTRRKISFRRNKEQDDVESGNELSSRGSSFNQLDKNLLEQIRKVRANSLSSSTGGSFRRKAKEQHEKQQLLQGRKNADVDDESTKRTESRNEEQQQQDPKTSSTSSSSQKNILNELASSLQQYNDDHDKFSESTTSTAANYHTTSNSLGQQQHEQEQEHHREASSSSSPRRSSRKQISFAFDDDQQQQQEGGQNISDSLSTSKNPNNTSTTSDSSSQQLFRSSYDNNNTSKDLSKFHVRFADETPTPTSSTILPEENSKNTNNNTTTTTSPPSPSSILSPSALQQQQNALAGTATLYFGGGANNNNNNTISKMMTMGGTTTQGHFGQTYANFNMTMETLRPAPPKKTKISFEEMKARHKFRTMRAAGILPHHDHENGEDNNFEVEDEQEHQQKQQNQKEDHHHHYNIQTGALLAGPVKLGVELSQLSPTDKDRQELEVFDATRDDMGSYHENQEDLIYNDDDDDDADENDTEENECGRSLVEKEREEYAAFINEKNSTSRCARSPSPLMMNRKKSPSRSRSRSRNSPRKHSPFSTASSDGSIVANNNNNNNSNNSPASTSPFRNTSPSKSTNKAPPRQTNFIHLSSKRRVPNRPTSAKVENVINDVISSRFLLPESKERLGRRFAQSVVVSTSQRSYIPISAESANENSTKNNHLRLQSARIVTMRASNSSSRSNNTNNPFFLTERPPSAPTHLSAATNSILHQLNITTDLSNSAASLSKNTTYSRRPVSARTTTSSSNNNTNIYQHTNDHQQESHHHHHHHPSKRPHSARTATTSSENYHSPTKSGILKYGTSVRARNQARHHNEEERARSLSRPLSAMSTTSNASQQQQYQVKKIVEKIVSDPDSDMATKIQPPTNGHGEVSSRRAADVLHHTSARTNELVQRKAAVENEAKRFRFKYDVESRKKRDVLMNRAGRMSECIDEALAPTTFNNIGIKKTLANREKESVVVGSSSSSKEVSARNTSKVQNLHPGRHWTPTPELVAWMGAPKSMAK